MNEVLQEALISDDELFEQAYQRVLPELDDFSGEVTPINVDIMSAVATAWGIMPELRALQEQVVRDLPNVDPRLFERVHDYALATAYAHTQHLIATEPPNNLRLLHEEASSLRETLLADANSLATRGIINGETLRDLRGPVGYKNVAQDLMMLTGVLKANWPQIVGRIPTSQEELVRAAKLAGTLVRGVGLREQGPAHAAETSELRAKIFTLFLRTYDEARKVVSFLRWRFDDVDDIIPSLWAGRGRRQTSNPDESAPEEPTLLAAGSVEAPNPAPVAAVIPLPGTAATAPAAAPADAPAGRNVGGPFMS